MRSAAVSGLSATPSSASDLDILDWLDGLVGGKADFVIRSSTEGLDIKDEIRVISFAVLSIGDVVFNRDAGLNFRGMALRSQASFPRMKSPTICDTPQVVDVPSTDFQRAGVSVEIQEGDELSESTKTKA